jgi:hypothetical protein
MEASGDGEIQNLIKKGFKVEWWKHKCWLVGD